MNRGNHDIDRRTFVWGLRRPMDLDVEITQVVLVGYGADPRNTVVWTYLISFYTLCTGSVQQALRLIDPQEGEVIAYGSATRRSVSLMMRLGRDIFEICGLEPMTGIWG